GCATGAGVGMAGVCGEVRDGIGPGEFCATTELSGAGGGTGLAVSSGTLLLACFSVSSGILPLAGVCFSALAPKQLGVFIGAGCFGGSNCTGFRATGRVGSSTGVLAGVSALQQGLHDDLQQALHDG